MKTDLIWSVQDHHGEADPDAGPDEGEDDGPVDCQVQGDVPLVRIFLCSSWWSHASRVCQVGTKCSSYNFGTNVGVVVG